MQVYEGKKSTDKWYPVFLADSVDLVTGETTKANTDLTVTYWTTTATSGTAYSPAAGDWKEIGNGHYSIQIGAGEFSTENLYRVRITCTGCAEVMFAVEVRDMTIAEFMDGVTLAADAIKATSYDESTAYPLALPDSGVSAIARLGG